MKDEGLDNSEVWDVDMALCKSDWAVFDIVHQGIKAMFTLNRAQEERQRLCLHGDRTTGWLKHQIQALANHLCNPGTIPTNWLKILLLSRENTLQSMLRIKSHGLLSIENIEILQQLRLHLLAAREQEARRPHIPEGQNEDMFLSQDPQPVCRTIQEDTRNDLLEEEDETSNSEDDGPGGESPDEIAEEIASALVRQDIQITIRDVINLASTSNMLDEIDLMDPG